MPYRPRAVDPSPTEIAERCLEVQATWTPAERAARMVVKYLPCRTQMVRLEQPQSDESGWWSPVQ